ncbi:unnamed protein product [Protopolystoma xenopodis]|uniref:Uncharacterized protein n=1 Tax=Protopolystoma xenopodis TaxID=117903 RepID=A0A448XJM8_9PLAT|nr:unnamed protein product [Protopolystoma xenopodis]
MTTIQVATQSDEKENHNASAVGFLLKACPTSPAGLRPCCPSLNFSDQNHASTNQSTECATPGGAESLSGWAVPQSSVKRSLITVGSTSASPASRVRADDSWILPSERPPPNAPILIGSVSEVLDLSYRHESMRDVLGSSLSTFPDSNPDPDLSSSLPPPLSGGRHMVTPVPSLSDWRLQTTGQPRKAKRISGLIFQLSSTLEPTVDPEHLEKDMVTLSTCRTSD